jgi:hypothetical protein
MQVFSSGTPIPVSFVLQDAHQTVISDSEVSSIASNCRAKVKIKARGQATYCATFNSGTHQFELNLPTTGLVRGPT